LLYLGTTSLAVAYVGIIPGGVDVAFFFVPARTAAAIRTTSSTSRLSLNLLEPACIVVTPWPPLLGVVSVQALSIADGIVATSVGC
jgi:hypothetical protein